MLGFSKQMISDGADAANITYSNCIQIGELIIFDEYEWANSDGVAVYTLLDVGTAYDQELFPLLFESLGSDVIDPVPNAPGSEISYKMVGDLQ